MPHPQETHQKPQAKRNLKRILSLAAMIVLSCSLLFSAGIFASYHQTIRANGLAAPEAVLPPQPAADGQVKATQPIPSSPDPLAHTPSIWPASGPVTSAFGWRNSPYGEGSEDHPGLDIAVGFGTPVAATADGTVVQSGWSGGYGNIVEIDHGNGIETIYGHNSQVLVSVGQTVKKGQVISYAGSTGRSTGPHVHYEVRVNGAAVNPVSYLVRY